MIDDGGGPAVKVFDKGMSVVDPEMVVDGGQEVAWTADAINGIFTPFVGGADESSRGNATPCPNIGKAAGPVVAAGLHGSCRGARIPRTSAGRVTDFRGAS